MPWPCRDLYIVYVLLFATPLIADEQTNLPRESPIGTPKASPAETPHPQSFEAIKQMGDELEADHKAREATTKAKQSGNQQALGSLHPDTEKATTTIKKQDLDRLKQQCDDARKELIAPRREKAIQEYIDKRVKTPGQCAQFYKDYGGSGTTAGGGFRQRMFHDIPECQPYYAAEKKDEWNEVTGIW